MRTAMRGLSVLAVVLGVASSSHAQTFDDVRIDVWGESVKTVGGQQRSAGGSISPVVIGMTETWSFSLVPEYCGGFGVGPGNRPPEARAMTHWTVDVTPLRVTGRTVTRIGTNPPIPQIQDKAVTFKLRWTRQRDAGKDSPTPASELEVTLHSGESMLFDSVNLPQTWKWPSGSPCNALSSGMRVSVNPGAWEDRDRRLVTADLWLVERQANGTERSQPLTVRGLFDAPIPFFFDTITDGGVLLDVFGEIVAGPQAGGIEVKLVTRSRIVQNGQSSTNLQTGNMFSARKVESLLTLKPEETVAVELPRLSENSSGAFSSRSLSIRLRVRQVR